MRNCEFCGTENTDFAAHCVACNEPMTAEAAKADVKVEEKKAHDRLLKKEVIYGGLAVATIGVLIFWGVNSYKKRALEGEVKAMYTAFRDANDPTVETFWKCMTRSEKIAKDNIELEGFLNAAIDKVKGSYVEYARRKCLPLIDQAPGRLEDVKMAPVMQEQYESYLGGVKVLKKQAEAFLLGLESMEKSIMRDDTLKKQAANYHYAGGESADTWAYDKFLRCAIPEFAKMTSMDELIGALGEVHKDPLPHVQRWRKECYQLIEQTAGTVADADYKKKVESFSTDDRDIEAFQDVIKKANAKERAASLEPFTKNWYTFAQQRDELLAGFKSYLSNN